jgi:TRAP-type mannitol/chloroaromatic compound transport system permease small subunit
LLERAASRCSANPSGAPFHLMGYAIIIAFVLLVILGLGLAILSILEER